LYYTWADGRLTVIHSSAPVAAAGFSGYIRPGKRREG